MNKSIKLGLLAIACFSMFSFMSSGEKFETIKIGSKAPLIKYKMASTVGEQTNLEMIQGGKGTLVIFSCNTCPFVLAWEGRYQYLAKLTSKNDVGFALINSNEAKRGGADSMEEMQAHAIKKGYAEVSYLLDKDSKLANAFGAKTTPHVFLFDGNWNLVYEGAIDDNYKSVQAVKEQYLNRAIENLAAGKTIEPENTKAMGCSIKRISG